MNINTEECLQFLKRLMTPRRYQHSLDVMNVMGDLSEVYELDNTQATMAGLLHDAARDFDPQQLLMFADEAQMTFFHPCEQHPVYLHAPVSAYLVSKALGITDSLVLGAISAHSYVNTGDDSNSVLSRCLRAADVLAPVREWRGMNKLKSLVYAGQLEEADLLQSGWLVEYFEEQDIPIHPDLTEKFQVLSSQLRVEHSFFERW